MTASPTILDQHLAYLARVYEPISAETLEAAWKRRQPLPRGAVLVTFDDAYYDFRELAWPILRRHGVPAVLFVPTAFVDQPERVFWWDAVWQMVARTERPSLRLANRVLTLEGLSRGQRLRATNTMASWLKSLPARRRAQLLDQLQSELGVTPEPTRAVLSWPELRRLAADGLTVAGHGRTHELLDQLDSAALADEVEGSRDDLRRELGRCPPLFAYPNGNFDARAAQAVWHAGFRFGFTTVHGLNNLATADLRLLRRDSARVSRAVLALKMATPIAAVRTARRPLR